MLALEVAVMFLDSMQRDFKEVKRNGNLAFKRWAICVGSVYGVVTCLVAGTATVLAVVSARPISLISTGYSPQVSQTTSVTTPHDR
jgi:TRAP-type mannitol/chloroaromatic compound transport system permease large subunit